MKTKSARLTKTSRSQTFNSRLAAYSATATGALLIAPAAQATIQDISSPTLNYTLTSNQQFFNPSLAAFHGSFYGSNAHISSNFFRGRAAMQSGHFLKTTTGSRRNAMDLAKSAAIAGANWGNYAQLAVKLNSSGSLRSVGQFRPGVNGIKTGYVGFKTVQNAHTYYGWLRVQVSGDANGLPDQISLLADGNGIVGAYDTASDVIVDNFGAGVTATPEPSVAALGGLALLACGAAGVREMRRSRQTQAKADKAD